MATKKTVARSGDTKKSTPPASTKRSVKAAAPSLTEEQRLAIVAEEVARVRKEYEADKARFDQEHRRAAELAGQTIPLTLGELCKAIGHDVRAESFAETAFMGLANQLEVVAEAAESTEFHGYEAWTFTQNILERMRLAGRVSAWIAQGATGKVLPEVQP